MYAFTPYAEKVRDNMSCTADTPCPFSKDKRQRRCPKLKRLNSVSKLVPTELLTLNMFANSDKLPNCCIHNSFF